VVTLLTVRTVRPSAGGGLCVADPKRAAKFGTPLDDGRGEDAMDACNGHLNAEVNADEFFFEWLALLGGHFACLSFGLRIW
jgi:hypothetical protein